MSDSGFDLFEGEEGMSWFRFRAAILFVLGVSPFMAVLAIAQETHTHGNMPEPLVAWIFHVHTVTIALAGLLGGLAHSVMSPPKTMQALLANIFFSVVSSVMLIPATVDWFFKDVSISALMFGSFLASMGAQRTVPLVLKRFESKLDTILVEKETTTTSITKEISKAPRSDSE